MIEIGKIISSAWKKNRDSDTKTQLFQADLLEDNDTQTLEEMHIPGVQYVPPVDSNGFFGRISEAFKIVLGIDDKVPKLEDLNPGERKAYASKDGAIVCSIWYKDDGTIQIDTTKDLNINTDGKVNFISADDFIITVDSGKKIAFGNGTDEFLQIVSDGLTEAKSLVGAALLAGTVDAPGVSSTGTLSVISGGLATMESAIDALITALGNIKV